MDGLFNLINDDNNSDIMENQQPPDKALSLMRKETINSEPAGHIDDDDDDDHIKVR